MRWVTLIMFAVTAMLLAYSCAYNAQLADACRAHGGVWHCPSTTCDCYTPDGRVMLPKE